MTEIEKVARAMCVADGRDPDATAHGVIDGIYMTGGQMWQAYYRRAKLAIAAYLECATVFAS